MARQKYTVTGDREIAGVKPGETVMLDPDETNVEALIAGGHVKPVRETKGGSVDKGAKGE